MPSNPIALPLSCSNSPTVTIKVSFDRRGGLTFTGHVTFRLSFDNVKMQHIVGRLQGIMDLCLYLSMNPITLCILGGLYIIFCLSETSFSKYSFRMLSTFCRIQQTSDAEYCFIFSGKGISAPSTPNVLMRKSRDGITEERFVVWLLAECRRAIEYFVQSSGTRSGICLATEF